MNWYNISKSYTTSKNTIDQQYTMNLQNGGSCSVNYITSYNSAIHFDVIAE